MTHLLIAVILCTASLPMCYGSMTEESTRIVTESTSVCPADAINMTAYYGIYGYFYTPFYPNSYPNNENCQWRLTSTLQFVRLEFTDFRTEPNYDIVYLRDGSTQFDPLITILSGIYLQYPLGPYVTSQRSMYIQFISDGSVHYNGFEALFTAVSDSTWPPPTATTSREESTSTLTESAPVCPADARNLTAGNGFYDYFYTPNYANNYPNNENCQWRLTSTIQFVRIEFRNFRTELCCDFVYVRDGSTQFDPLITRLSGVYSQDPLGPYVTSQRSMYIQFISDGSVVDTGFEASFTASLVGGSETTTPVVVSNGTEIIPDATAEETHAWVTDNNSTWPPPTATTSAGDRGQCPWYPMELNESSGIIESPGYPFSYPWNVNCQWRILSTAQAVSLSFNFFETDSCCDFVTVYDGASDASQQLANLAGFYNVPPSGIKTTQPYMFIRFTSDRYNSYGGFQATYTSIRGDACSAATRPLQLTEESGFFTSANYPGQYNDSGDCRWLIVSKFADGSVSLLVDDFDTESCCDVMTIYDGTSTKDPVIAVLSGTYSDLPQQYNSSRRNMFVRFLTDSTLTSRGFFARYSAIGARACSSDTNPQEITGFTGTIQSPNYPGNYFNDATCQWLITSAYFNGIVTLGFDFFRTEACCDTLTVYNGDNVKSPKLAVLAGTYQPVPENVTSTQRRMLVRFVSDDTVNDIGFRATYFSNVPTITSCGSVLRVAPNGTAADVGWGPVCYITNQDTTLLNVSCRDLIQDLPPNIGDSSSLLLRGGNFGCGASPRNDFIGSDFVCQDNYNQGLTLGSVPTANKMLVCIRLPPTVHN